ncbi:MAG: TcpQ domain-containing protein, partial [Rhodospirillales bacterium]|nr:TcpQ domain-containing protein [Rhodospirillales bacterium]
DVLHRGDSLWIVDPARHETLLDVLEDWGSDAGWSVVWNSGRRYAVRAGASFEGTFLDAVDLLMAAPATRRSLVAMAYEPNRHLVVDDAEALR